MSDARIEPARHWDAAYDQGTENVSWTQDEATVSLQLIEQVAVPHDAAVIDIGGGASPLTANLLDRGFTDLSVLDISQRALDAARAQLGDRADAVNWVCADLRDWQAPRQFGLWHDRAVLHFLTGPEDQQRYADLVARAVAPGGHVVIATFAPDGPERCSGLPVVRYSPADLGQLLGSRFELVAEREETHHTPRGTPQKFTWVAARRSAGDDM